MPQVHVSPEGAVSCRRLHTTIGNLAHWTGNAPSARNVIYYYNESQLTAIRIGNWKSHMMTREGFFDYTRPSALLFNLRMDPFEKHDGWKSQEIAMKLGIAWGGQVTYGDMLLRPEIEHCTYSFEVADVDKALDDRTDGRQVGNPAGEGTADRRRNAEGFADLTAGGQ